MTTDHSRRPTTSPRPRGLGTPSHLVPLTAAMATFLLTIVAPRLAGCVGDEDRRERERGDVPGWVLVTLMTAGLVTTIWALAGTQLAQLFTQAIAAVTGPGKQ